MAYEIGRWGKIRKDIEHLNNTKNELDLFVIYITFHPKATEHTFFSSTPRTFTIIDGI